MLTKEGQLDAQGHPYVEITVSANGSDGSGISYQALIDTGFTGFVSLPFMAAGALKLQPHTSTTYELANGKQSDPIPLARAFACVTGDKFKAGLISISEHSGVLVGVEFLRTCGKGLLFLSTGISLIDEEELRRLTAQSQAGSSPSGSTS